MQHSGRHITTLSDKGFHTWAIIALSLLTLRASCQTAPEGIIIHDTDKFNEELYMQTDRDLYISGETVCLKIFCLNRLTHKPSFVSKVVYVSLLDNLNNPVVQVKMAINGFTASGLIELPDTTPSGNYLISSCTQWMQNFSPNLFSYRTISVINPFENPEKAGIPIMESFPGFRKD
jgi:hypothetical protein